MDDKQIIDLYWKRSETAISETAVKYGNYCYSIAYNVLNQREDAEESVNDTYLAAWNKLPPHRPAVLSAFLGKITRYISISRWRSRNAYKRCGGEMPLALEELGQCVSDGLDVETNYARKETVAAVNCFLDNLPEMERNIFLRRYWCLDAVGDIAASFGFSENKVSTMLYRTRKKLHTMLEKRASGIDLR